MSEKREEGVRESGRSDVHNSEKSGNTMVDRYRESICEEMVCGESGLMDHPSDGRAVILAKRSSRRAAVSVLESGRVRVDEGQGSRACKTK